MIRLRVSTLNPKFEVEIETDDKDFKKGKKLLDHVIEKLGSNDSSTISVRHHLYLLVFLLILALK